MKAKNSRDICIAGIPTTEAICNGNNGVNTWKRRDVNNSKIPATAEMPAKAEMPTTANAKSSREVSHSMETSNCRDCRCC